MTEHRALLWSVRSVSSVDCLTLTNQDSVNCFSGFVIANNNSSPNVIFSLCSAEHYFAKPPRSGQVQLSMASFILKAGTGSRICFFFVLSAAALWIKDSGSLVIWSCAERSLLSVSTDASLSGYSLRSFCLSLDYVLLMIFNFNSMHRNG